MEDDIKESLEKRKLELEIRDLAKPIWKKISFYTTLSSLIVALAGLYIGYYSGFFDNQKIVLEIKRSKLEKENTILEDKIVSLNSDTRSLGILKSQLKKEKMKLTKDKLKLEKIKIALMQEKNTLIDENSVLVKENKILVSNIESMKLDLGVLREELKNIIPNMEKEVEIALLRDLNEFDNRDLLYLNGFLSSILYPQYFSAVEVPKKYFDEVKEYLSQIAWDISNPTGKNIIRLLPSRKRDGLFHSWISLQSLLMGDSKWLYAHALEVTYDKKKATKVFNHMLKIKVKYRKEFLEKHVRRFPPLIEEINRLNKKYGVEMLPK